MRARRDWDRTLTARPYGASAAVGCRALAVVLAVAAAGVLLAAALWPDGAWPFVVGSADLALAAVVWFRWSRMPIWAFWSVHLAGGLGLAAVAALVATPAHAVCTLVLYAVLLLESFFVLSWLEACIQFVIGAAAVLTAVHVREPGHGGAVLFLLGVLAVCCAMVGWLVRALQQADHDALTGALSRRGTQMAVEALIARAHTRQVPLTLALIDMDHFKAVNDTLGHAEGDALLLRVADGARAAVPRSSVFGRWGGDEFLLALWDADARDAGEVIDALRRYTGPPNTLSAGAAELAPGDDLAALLQRADEALYRVKHTGRGTTGTDRRTRPTETPDTPDDGTYVPIVAVPPTPPAGCEPAPGPTGREVVALMAGRWTPLTPGLLTRSLTDAMSWPTVASRLFQTTPGPRTLLLRLCPEQDPTTLDLHAREILAALAACGAQPGRVAVTIAEPVLDAASDRVRAVVGPLREAGVAVVLSEVGSGAMSLARLRAAPVDALWLSRRLLPAADGDAVAADHTPIASALATLATIRELPLGIGGVQTPDQVAWARRVGCSYVSGPLYAPVSARQSAAPAS